MGQTLKDLIRELGVRCDDVVEGIATGGTTTSLIDSRLADAFSDDDVFNGGTLVLNEGGGNILFSDSCEGMPPGDFTSVTVDTGCKVYRDKTYKKDGKWSYKFITGSTVSDYAYVSKTLSAAQTTLYAQVNIYATADYTGAATILQFQTAAAGAVLSLKLTGGNLSIYNEEATETYTPTSVDVTVNTWHRVEMAVVVSATVGQVHLWLDEEHIYSGRGLNTGSTDIGIVLTGLVATTIAEAKTIYVDAVKVDTAYIGTRVAETEKVISDYTGTSGTVAWSGAIVAPTANYTRYAIYDWPKAWRSRDQKKRAINNAIRTMYPYWFKEVVDPPTDGGSAASITTVRNTFYYELPDDCESVLNVYIEPEVSTNPYWQEVNWQMDMSGGTRYLRLPNAASYTTGLDVRVHYIARPVPLENDNDELNVDDAHIGNAVEYIMHHALGYLWGNTSVPSQTDQNQADRHMQMAQMYKQKYPMPMRTRTMQMRTREKSVDFNDRIIVG